MKKTRVIAAIAAVAVAAGAASHAFALDSQGQENGGSVSAANTAPNSEDDFDFTVNDDFTEITITKYKGTRKDVVIPASIQDVPVVRIGNRAFYRNKNITSVVIPEGVRVIEDGEGDASRDDIYGAFAKCESLVSVTLPKDISIGKYAFYECRLRTVTIPEGGTLVESSFSDCKSLLSVTLPEGLKAIPESCFYNCHSLTQINFPSTLKYIGNKAFSGRYNEFEGFLSNSLSSVDLPEGLEYLGSHAFVGDSITSVSLPKSLKWVEYKGIKYQFARDDFRTLITGDNIASITIAADCAPKVLVSGDSVESVDGRNLIEGATINKTIRLQKTLADWKPAVCDVGKYDQLTDDGKELFADLQRYGFTEEEAQEIVAGFCK